MPAGTVDRPADSCNLVRNFTVCVLLYGDFPKLAARCLGKIAALAKLGAIELRIGCNAISARSESVLREFGVARHVVCSAPKNLKKYPMMRRLFAGGSDAPSDGYTVSTPYVMWFDDDSYISSEDPLDWLASVERQMARADLIGSVYHIWLNENQRRWIHTQPWYAGQPFPMNDLVPYPTGGWWAVRTSLLRQYDWPLRALVHRGGDVMLGELVRQQGLRLAHFRQGVAINANVYGEESQSRRRGFDSDPIGWDYQG
ncbi:MAG TPA: hypothetical protein VHE61_03135 [Opitutaceae bacterium]|nr:hypothetical protein [Opitutaceae bacterium]